MHVKNANQEQEKRRLGVLKNVFRNKEISVWRRAEHHINNADALYKMAHGKFSLRGALYPSRNDQLFDAAKLYHAAAIDFIISGHPLRAAESFEKSADTHLEYSDKLVARTVNDQPVHSKTPLPIYLGLKSNHYSPIKNLHLAAMYYLGASILYGEGHRRGHERSSAAAQKILLDFGFKENDIAKEQLRMERYISSVAAAGQ